jgi:Ca2+-binding EF-hand superfamily protein
MSHLKAKPTTEQIVGMAVDNIFKKYDENHDNLIDFREFCKMIDDLKLTVKISSQEMGHIF